MLSLAGKIGVGSIAGVSLAIYLGGPGTIFWIWLVSFISLPLTYVETYLGMKYRIKKDNSYLGGPSYYIERGLSKPKLAIIYSLIVFICYAIGFTSVQSNTITKCITTINNINPLLIGIILGLITLLIIIGGIAKITNITDKLVPIMSIIYITLALYITCKNITIIPKIFKLIIDNAFTPHKAFIATSILGIQRGIFSTESGVGTSSIIASSTKNNNPIISGYIQMLGVYVTSFLICTSTAIIILTSNYGILNINNINGIEISLFSFTYHLGKYGSVILVIQIIMFAFSSILTGYYYGEISLKYIFPNITKNNIFIYRIIIIIIIILSSIFSSLYIWQFTDFFIAILTLINIYTMYKLKKEI